jgi:hypothetical protein
MKQKRVILCLAVLLSMSAMVFANASVKVSEDPNYEHVFYYRYGQPTPLWWDTINDWEKIGDANYSNFFTLTSDTNVAEDEIDDWVAAPGHELRCHLEIMADQGQPGASYPVPADTWAGYGWTLPAGYDDEVIVKFKVAGFFNFEPDFGELWLLDDHNDFVAHITKDPTPGFPYPNWINPYYEQEWLLPEGTKSVKLVLVWTGDYVAWTGNYVWLYLMEMTTALEPICGDDEHPYPVGDLTEDCVVNFEDFAMLADNWLVDEYPYPVGDLTEDCVVNFEDVAEFAANWLADNRP